MKNPLIVAALIVTCATPAMAGSRYAYGYGQDRDTTTDYAQVLSARPIYREVRVREPQRECWDERVVYRDDAYDRGGPRYAGNAERTVGTVLGGVIGGAIGHQFSAGSGQQIATAIGAVVGADIARNRYERDDVYRAPRERVAYEPRCRSYEQTRYEQRIDGYDVTYRYRGQVYNTQMPYDPGARLPVRVDVTPLR